MYTNLQGFISYSKTPLNQFNFLDKIEISVNHGLRIATFFPPKTGSLKTVVGRNGGLINYKLTLHAWHISLFNKKEKLSSKNE